MAPATRGNRGKLGSAVLGAHRERSRAELASQLPSNLFSKTLGARGRKRLAPGDEVQNLKLHRLAWLFKKNVEENIPKDPNPGENVRFLRPRYKRDPSGESVEAVVARVIDDPEKGRRFEVEVPVNGRRGLVVPWITSRRRITRIRPRFCRSPEWVERAEQTTGFDASEVPGCGGIDVRAIWEAGGVEGLTSLLSLSSPLTPRLPRSPSV